MEVLGREEGWKGERDLSIEVWEVLFFVCFFFVCFDQFFLLDLPYSSDWF